jgi:hypothetical protein
VRSQQRHKLLPNPSEDVTMIRAYDIRLAALRLAAWAGGIALSIAVWSLILAALL